MIAVVTAALLAGAPPVLASGASVSFAGTGGIRYFNPAYWGSGNLDQQGMAGIEVSVGPRDANMSFAASASTFVGSGSDLAVSTSASGAEIGAGFRFTSRGTGFRPYGGLEMCTVIESVHTEDLINDEVFNKSGAAFGFAATAGTEFQAGPNVLVGFEARYTVARIDDDVIPRDLGGPSFALTVGFGSRGALQRAEDDDDDEAPTPRRVREPLPAPIAAPAPMSVSSGGAATTTGAAPLPATPVSPAVLANFLSGDHVRVTRMNGVVVEGKLVEVDDMHVVVAGAYSGVYVSRSDIAKIEHVAP